MGCYDNTPSMSYEEGIEDELEDTAQSNLKEPVMPVLNSGGGKKKRFSGDGGSGGIKKAKKKDDEVISESSSWMACHSDQSRWRFDTPPRTPAVSETGVVPSQSRRPKMRVIAPYEKFTFRMSDIEVLLEESEEAEEDQEEIEGDEEIEYDEECPLFSVNLFDI